MAGGVLVQQGVVEDSVERADPPLAVDERQLTEPGATVVLRNEGPQRLGAGVRVRLDLDRAALLEPDGQPFDDPALRVQRLGRLHDTFDACRIRRGEHLLRRQVRHVRDPVDGFLAAADPA